MSLNPCEQRVYDYLELKPEERKYWYEKVHLYAQSKEGREVGIQRLDSELWKYYVERSSVVSHFKEAVRSEGLNRTSMRNLAELLTRVWVKPNVRKVLPRKKI